jgi:hypothetical protein
MITDRRARLHRALDAAFDMSKDMLDKLKAHEFSARKIGSTKEADAFLAKIRQYEPGYTSKESGPAAKPYKPQSVSYKPQGVPLSDDVQRKTYRQCTMVISRRFARGVWQTNYVIVSTPEGQRAVKDDEQAAKRWIDSHWKD